MHEDVWTGFSPFRSVSFSQRFLAKCYRLDQLDKAEALSYQNSYPFLYYLQYGRKHYALAEKAPVELKPLLLFYGMTQLVKACLLTKDPDYPKTTEVLAHGASTRKKKKKNYAFFKDEVRIQKHGLVPYFANTLFGIKQLEGRKYTMDQLLRRLPDLNSLFADMLRQPPLYKMIPEDSGELGIPFDILDDLHMTFPRFASFLERRLNINASQISRTEKGISIQGDTIKTKFPSSLSGQSYIPRSREHYDNMPEVLVHFLLLYNLSMISRYETEWWSELFLQTAADELPFIETFLHLTKEKIPLLIARYLRDFM
ncbi:MAG TPA: YaaC family protein [Bacillales bacterium]|nr:YaaC family protein [Bacillales bacterium]